MKNLVFLLLVSTMAIVSCDKEDQLSRSDQLEVLSFEDQSFSNDFSVALEVLEDGDQLEVLLGEDGYEFKITDRRLVPSQTSSRAVRCRGNGVSFVKCVKRAVDKYGCQKITGNGDDYVSEDC